MLRPPRATRPYTLFPYAPLFRSPTSSCSPVRTSGISCAIAHHPFSYRVTTNAHRLCVMNRLYPLLWPRLKSPSRSEEHTSELQSLMRISYAVFCLKKHTTTLYHHRITSIIPIIILVIPSYT